MKLKQELCQQLLEELSIPPFGTLGGAPIRSEILNACASPTEVFNCVLDEIEKQARMLVDLVLVESLRNGLHAGLMFEIHGLDCKSQSFCYAVNEIADCPNSTSSDISDTSVHSHEEGIINVRRGVAEQHLVFGQMFDFDALIHNPFLEIPFAYRAMLKNAPAALQPFIVGLFGTQVAEKTITRDTKQEKYSIQKSEEVPYQWRSTWFELDPCILFGPICLAGWGERQMTQFRDLNTVSSKERKLLNKVASLWGATWTYFLCGAALGLLTILQLLGQKALSITIVAASVPTIICSILFFALGVNSFVRFLAKRRSSRKRIQRELNLLKAKYPGFDPKEPRLSKPARDYE